MIYYHINIKNRQEAQILLYANGPIAPNYQLKLSLTFKK